MLWQYDKLFSFDRAEKEIVGNIEKFFDLMEETSRKFGVKLFVIDNLMSILEENADSLFSDQANFIQRCKDFAVRNHVHIVLLAHPIYQGQTIYQTRQIILLQLREIGVRIENLMQ